MCDQTVSLVQHTSTPQMTIAQGIIHCTSQPKILATILGSCVAVCLWDKIRGAGGMNHFVLPSNPLLEKSGRYGDVAIDELVDGMCRLGCRLADLQAKVFGGAEVLPFGDRESVGAGNVRLALNSLKQHHILVVVQRTGGVLGQHIRFNTGTGEVLFRHLPRHPRP